MKTCILGAGAFGLSLSSIFNKNKHDVTVWTHSKEEEKTLTEKRTSPKLKTYKIPSKIKITTNLKNAIKNSSLVVIAVPAHAVDDVSKKISEYITKDTHILIATKGIENGSCELLTEVVSRHINTNKLAIISGPSFAIDIVENVPIGFSLATTNSRTRNLIKTLMENENIKIRTTLDIIGVQICGSIKNVMAIASGMLDGMRAPAACFLSGAIEILNDIKDLIEELGGNKNTILSLAGFGDIILTCTSINSRNFTYGKLIGEGKIKEAENYQAKTTVEGLYTLKSIKELIKKEHVKMEVVDLISDIICGNKEKETMLKFLVEKK